MFAPCTRRVAPCPALADARDWCHEDRPLALPPRTAELARLTHLRDGGMKFAYLVLRRHPLDLVRARRRRLARGQRADAGEGQARADRRAAAHGRIPLRLLNRHRAHGNREFERAERGDVLAIAAAPDADRVEVRDTTAVERLDGSGPAAPVTA